VYSKVLPVVVLPEAFVSGDAITAAIDSITCGFAIFPAAVVSVSIDVNYTSLSTLTVFSPHSAVPGPFRLHLLTVTMFDLGVFLDLTVIYSSILFDELFY
jgi:hypothetical protein